MPRAAVDVGAPHHARALVGNPPFFQPPFFSPPLTPSPAPPPPPLYLRPFNCSLRLRSGVLPCGGPHRVQPSSAENQACIVPFDHHSFASNRNVLLLRAHHEDFYCRGRICLLSWRKTLNCRKRKLLEKKETITPNGRGPAALCQEVGASALGRWQRASAAR